MTTSIECQTSKMYAITEQPRPTTESKELYKSGPLTIRTLVDTEEDGEFFGRLMIEAFRDKIVHASRESVLPVYLEHATNHCRGRPLDFYDQNAVAEYNGVRAGICGVYYKDDDKKFPRKEFSRGGIGCCDLLRLACLDSCLTEKIKEGYCCLDYLCVSEEFRGKGIGKTLLDIAEKNARKHKCQAIFLIVLWTNPARRLYSRQGYDVTKTSTCCRKVIVGDRKIARMDKSLL